MNKKELKKLLTNLTSKNINSTSIKFLDFFKEKLQSKNLYEVVKIMFSIDNIENFDFDMRFLFGGEIQNVLLDNRLYSKIFFEIYLSHDEDYYVDYSIDNFIRSSIFDFLAEYNINTNLLNTGESVYIVIDDNFTIKDLSNVLKIPKTDILKIYNESTLMHYNFVELQKNSEQIKDDLNVVFM